MVIKIPGLLDVHVHMREPGGTHKEDWDSGSASALAGGVTMTLAMPNTHPPVCDDASLAQTLQTAATKSRCDFAQFVGAGPDNADSLAALAPRSAGLKMYLDQTYGPLRLDDMRLWMAHFSNWPRDLPIVAHAESRSMAAVILMADLFARPVHIAHVSLAEEITLIRAAKEKGIAVTCEVTPHHLFLTQEDIPAIGTGRSEVRPRLATAADRDALWANLDVIDCFATDHAPHTLAEKDSTNPPPGFPGVETALPLLLTAVHDGRLTLDDIIRRMVTNPSRIFRLPPQPDTWVELDPDQRWVIHAADLHSRCAWTPFEGWPVTGRVERVVLRGQEAYRNGKILAAPGSGRDVRAHPGD